MPRRSLLQYGRYRYLKAAGLLSAGALLAYAADRPPVPPYGGTGLGYVLGTAAALLACAQAWLGVRRRRDGCGTLQAWVSAHVYLGAALVVLATLHSGFQFGWNVHTLSYVLMMALFATGCYGVLMYVRIPRLMTENMGEDSFDDLLRRIADLDERARVRALHLPDAAAAIVMTAVRETAIGGSVSRQLSGHHPDCPTHEAICRLQHLGEGLDAAQAEHHRELYALLLRKESLLIRARQELAFRARLGFWLYLHAPLAVAALAALAAHVVSVLYFR